MNNKTIAGLAGFLGTVFLILAIVYFATPAQSLPHFFPGYESGLDKIHVKHGIALVILAFGAFSVAWFQGGKKN